MNQGASTQTLPREFYTREQVAEMFRVSVRTVDEWISSGKLGSWRLRRVVRIPSTAIARFYEGWLLLARKERVLPAEVPPGQALLVRGFLEPLTEEIVKKVLPGAMASMSAEKDAA
jgi:excisionase family DNA binding protein